MIDARLVEIPNEAPPYWVLYAHVVLLRAVAQGNRSAIGEWCDWAGGATFLFFPSDSTILSNFALISDGARGIGVFAGTRSLTQILLQIVGSSLSDDIGQSGARISSFDLFYADAVTAVAKENIPASLRGAPILIVGHSLGGAVANVFAARKVDGTFADVGLLTFGQPRTGDQSLQLVSPPRYCRIVNENDPVPGVPPRTQNIGGYYLFGQSYYDPNGYVHGGQAYLITNDAISPTTDEDTGTDAGAMASALLEGATDVSSIELYHPLQIYGARVYPFALEQGGGLPLPPLVNISREIAGQPPLIPNPADAPIVPPPPSLGAFVAPGFVPLPVPGSLPSQFLGQSVELVRAPDQQIPPSAASAIFGGLPAMPVITKCTFFYSQQSQGWAETYYNQATRIQDVLNNAYSLGSALMAFRGINTAMINLRISLVTLPLAFPVLRTVRLFPRAVGWNAGSFVSIPPNNPPANWSDFYSSCVLMSGVPATVGQRAKSIFMRGFPDDYDIGGGQLAGPLYQYFGFPRLITLQSALAPLGSPFGWLGTIRPADMTTCQQPISSVAQNSNGTVTVSLTNPLATTPVGAAGNSAAFFPVRISGAAARTLNGVQSVWVDPTGLKFTTRKRIAIKSTDVFGGTLTYIPKTFIPFSGQIIFMPRVGNVTTYGNLYARAISTRKAGATFGVAKGRMRNRVRA
jgi:Lipase (class 3)